MSSVDSWLAAVYASPDSDAPRAELAGRLAGTPRGEYLSLVLGSPSRVSKARAKMLLDANLDEWLEPLRGALARRTVRWERGFPVAGRLAAQRTAADAEALVGLPALATLRTLDLELPNTVLREEWLARFLFDSPLRGLRELRGFRPGLLVAMLRAQPSFAIEVLEVSLGYDPGSLDEIHSAFATGRGLPRLRELGLSLAIGAECSADRYAWLWETETGRRVQRLSINVDAYLVREWRDVLETHCGPKSGVA